MPGFIGCLDYSTNTVAKLHVVANHYKYKQSSSNYLPTKSYANGSKRATIFIIQVRKP